MPSELVITVLAYATINGRFGNGIERERNLGWLYDSVQRRVNELMKVQELAKWKN